MTNGEARLRELVKKWRQNSKGVSGSNFVRGMDHQAGICAEELEAALAAPVQAERLRVKLLREDRDAWRKRAEEAEEGLARRIFGVAGPSESGTDRRLRGLIVQWRENGTYDSCSGRLPNPVLHRCADELEAALRSVAGTDGASAGFNEWAEKNAVWWRESRLNQATIAEVEHYAEEAWDAALASRREMGEGRR